ncbi:hypothetical protein [Stenotrophomonas sp. YAU14D1_LEIMI4_1]|uniref:hypothetical protein n=1 Tax=Stenotrophomonas sp. YAU14D1_LEIMI4_1 TaxID=2072407 RepID=UPI000D53F07E|nr:hypothetical protein [Stenotrophomonas sp. YAU14D1_LEIMI4_1]AWH24012.1 hypothetical protein C1932_02175 [Stenotrophomonas sp. YAU14D1_LEIMI4_1]
MPIEFKPDSNSAFDASSAVRISFPRILPAKLPDGSEAIEYQYTFRRDGARIASIGILGTEILSVRGGAQERLCTLDLSTCEVFESIIDLKRDIDNSDDTASFIHAVAQGLLNVFSTQPSIFESIRYVAVCRVDSLSQLGVAIAEDGMELCDGVALLASLSVAQQRNEAG